jgi:hypothetical protein
MAVRAGARLSLRPSLRPIIRLDMPDGSSVEFIAIGMEEFDAEREIFLGGRLDYSEG